MKSAVLNIRQSMIQLIRLTCQCQSRLIQPSTTNELRTADKNATVFFSQFPDAPPPRPSSTKLPTQNSNKIDKARWPSGLRRCVQEFNRFLEFRSPKGRGFESHSCHQSFAGVESISESSFFFLFYAFLMST